MSGRPFLVLALGCALAAPALAGVLGVRTPVTSFSTPDTALTGHTGYVLTLATDDGSLITALDVAITGQLHQRWAIDPDEGTTIPNPANTNLTNGDSHLTPLANALFVLSPTEDNSGVGSPLSDTATRDYGYGTMLRATWGILGGSQTTQAAVAYVVIPAGSESSLAITGQVATSAGSYAMPVFRLPIEQHFSASPSPGSPVEFGRLTQGADPAAKSITLALGQLDRLTVSSFALTGPAADRFLVRGLPSVSLDLDQPEGTWQVGFASPSAPPGEYRAALTFQTSAGEVIYPLSAIVVPEPTAAAIFCLLLVTARCNRRRRL